MRNITLTILAALALLAPNTTFAQDDDDRESMMPKLDTMRNPVRKVYLSNGMDAAILSTAMLETPTKNTLTTLRFSYFLNLGLNFNYNFSNHFGAFVGVGIKNIGFIEKYPVQDSTVKRRLYTAGIPVGIKVGNMGKSNYFMLGGGIDFAINYREKGFKDRGDKTKFNEFFSDRTPATLPYAFVGFAVNHVTFKFQYYPSNFMNPDFIDGSGIIPTKPYAGYNVNLIYLSLGFDIHYTKSRK